MDYLQNIILASHLLLGGWLLFILLAIAYTSDFFFIVWVILTLYYLFICHFFNAIGTDLSIINKSVIEAARFVDVSIKTMWVS